MTCLDSLERHIPQDRLNVVVVDNASQDAALGQLRDRVSAMPGWRFIGLHRNIGFGAACNRGAEQSTAEWLCFLNPDTVAGNDFLQCLWKAAESSGADLLGPAYGPPRWLEWNCGRFPGPILEGLSIAMLGRPLEAFWMGLRRRLGGKQPLSVDWVLGACMLLQRERFEFLGGFDESFFLYYEEMDLCRRLVDSGGKTVFVSGCRIHHTGSVSGRRDYRAFTRRFYEGKLHFLYKHAPGFRGRVTRRIVWLQLQFQRLLWHLPVVSKHPRAEGKRAGVADVLAMIHHGFPWEHH
jgi:GT2 family glycosyltransferase